LPSGAGIRSIGAFPADYGADSCRFPAHVADRKLEVNTKRKSTPGTASGYEATNKATILTVDEDVLPNTFRVSLRWQGKHSAFVNLAKRLASYRWVLVHRDFQSQNIIVWNEQAYLIDFQGVRPGLPQYDLASLLLLTTT
jgi:phosphotransferase family enzyme